MVHNCKNRVARQTLAFCRVAYTNGAHAIWSPFHWGSKVYYFQLKYVLWLVFAKKYPRKFAAYCTQTCATTLVNRNHTGSGILAHNQLIYYSEAHGQHLRAKCIEGEKNETAILLQIRLIEAFAKSER